MVLLSIQHLQWYQLFACAFYLFKYINFTTELKQMKNSGHIIVAVSKESLLAYLLEEIFM